MEMEVDQEEPKEFEMEVDYEEPEEMRVEQIIGNTIEASTQEPASSGEPIGEGIMDIVWLRLSYSLQIFSMKNREVECQTEGW